MKVKLPKKRVSIPEVGTGFSVNVSIYGDDTVDGLIDYLGETPYRPQILSGELNLLSGNGFVVRLGAELSFYVYLNKDSDLETLESILVHELFHVAFSLQKTMESEEYGARIYTRMYKEFMPFVKKYTDSGK